MMDETLQSLRQDYEIRSLLGRGGMGDVYLAYDRRLERLVAIKLLRIPENQNPAEFIRLFQTEARAIASLFHPNIVGIYDFGESDGAYYIVMEYLPGQPLNVLIEDYPRIPISLCLTVGIQICSALDYIHQHGVIHRDIKPANIVLSRTGEARLTDFGIVHFSTQPAESAETMAGTFKYSAPEQLVADGSADHRSDIFSLGLTLYELLTENHPFEAETTSEFVQKLFQGQPPSAREVFFDIPEKLDQILAKAMAPFPEMRYQRAAEMGQDLAELLDHQALKRVLAGPMFRIQSALASENLTQTKSKSQDTGKAIHASAQASARQVMEVARQNLGWIDTLLQNLPAKDYQSISKQMFLDKMVVSGFNGFALINEDVYAFIQNGCFIDFISKDLSPRLKKSGEEIFQILPETLDSIRLYMTQNEQVYLPCVVSNLVTEPAESVLDSMSSSMHDLNNALQSFLSENLDFTGYLLCRTGSEIYCYGYSSGQELFCLFINHQNCQLSEYHFEKVVTSRPTVLSIFQIQLTLLPVNHEAVLKRSELRLSYRDPAWTLRCLSTPVELEPDERHMFQQSLQLDAFSQLGKPLRFRLAGTFFDLGKVIQVSPLYRLVEYLLREFFIQLQASSQHKAFTGLLEALPLIEKVSFCQKLEGSPMETSYSAILSASGPPHSAICLVQMGDGAPESIEAFIQEVRQLKTSSASICEHLKGVFYLAQMPYGPGTRTLLQNYTDSKEELFGQHATGYVPVTDTDGFHVFLGEYQPDTPGFNLNTPLIV